MRDLFKRLTKEELRIGALLWPERNYWRPKTRGDCVNVSRPCPYVACRHNLSVDITVSGTVRIRAGVDALVREASVPGQYQEVWDRQTPNCSLDVAELGGLSYKQLGYVMGRTRQRAEQEVAAALRNFMDALQAAGFAHVEETKAA